MDVKIEEPGKNNVHNNAFYAEEKLLKSESEAMRDCNPLSARHWIVSSYHLYIIRKITKRRRNETCKIPIFLGDYFHPPLLL